MNKFLKVLFILLLIGLFVFLATNSYCTHKQLEAMSFIEGQVVETNTGGIVTASTKSWVYFEDDAFILNTKATGKSVEEIFCTLHKDGIITSFSGKLFKAKYTKEIIVKVGETEKSYYLVGDYYITGK